LCYLLTVDVGTTAVKTCLFDQRLSLIAGHTAEYGLVTPAENIVELDPERYWDALCAGTAGVLRLCPDPRAIRMLTITTQGETLIAVDKDGRALGNAIVWLDARAVRECEELKQKIDAAVFYRHTGLSELTPSAPIAKLLWFSRNLPEIYKKTARFLLLEDYLIMRLTGLCVSNPALLSSSGYFDINRNVYWRQILDAAEIDRNKLPDIYPSAVIAAKVDAASAAQTGLPEGTPVSTGAVDQAASALGSGNIRKGMVTETTGTCLAVVAAVEKPDYDNPLRPAFYRHFNGLYFCMAYNPAGAIILKWFKDEFMPEFAAACEGQGIPAYREMDTLARKIPPGSDGLILIPHFGGRLVEEVNNRARGVLFGLSLEMGRPHVIRAILEALAYMLRENLEYLERCGIKAEELRSIGGGSRSALWNSIKADICGRDILVMRQSESASLGAAMMGALAAGLYGSADEMTAFLKTEALYHPDAERGKIYDAAYQKYLSIYRCLSGIF
jgi:xylulokinase